MAIASVRRGTLVSVRDLLDTFRLENSLTVAAVPIGRKRDLAENASRALWSIKGWRISPTPRKNKDVDDDAGDGGGRDDGGGDGGGGDGGGEDGGGGETYYALLSQ